MEFKEFVELANKQDSRNVFSKCDDRIENVPEDLRTLYEQYNPIDVEVKINGAFVRFFPYERIKDIQDEYALDETCFVFAECNGDPIYLKAGYVYSCVFEGQRIIEELLSNSIYDYLGLIEK